MDDEKLVARLAAERMPLTLCPLSNLKLRVIKDMKDYPLKAMMAKGLMCTLNSDDPAYFGGYLSDFKKQIYLDEVEKFYLENRW